MVEAAAIVIGYLFGSIPTAYIAGRLRRGVDIRKIGGSNMGALNVAREIGRGEGAVVFMIDAAKGAGAILVARYLGLSQLWVLLAGFASVVGHNWPIFLNFRGGKGAATTIGIFLTLVPREFACCLPIMGIVIGLTSNVTLGVATGLVFLPLFLWLFSQSLSIIIYAIVTVLFLGLRYLPTAKRSLERAASARDFVIDRNYKPWQTRKNKPLR
jgi:glycerol-3-phosphate acyltransferase PlsY